MRAGEGWGGRFLRRAGECWFLPHEIAFLLFYVIILIRLAAAPRLEPLFIFSYAAYLALATLLVVWCRRNPSPTRWRVRLFYYSLVMLAVYFTLGKVVAAFQAPFWDAQLQAADRFLAGGDLSMRMQAIIHPALTEAVSAAYMFFMLYLAVGQLAYWLGRLDLAVRFYIGLFVVYGIGFIGYSCVPAHGPYVVFAGQFAVPLEGWILTRLNDHMVHFGSNGVDVFPSLHVAVPAFILFFDFLHHRRRFWICLVPCLFLWLSTVYLRYHYLVDVLAGFLLAVLALVLACKWPLGGMETGKQGIRESGG